MPKENTTAMLTLCAIIPGDRIAALVIREIMEMGGIVNQVMIDIFSLRLVYLTKNGFHLTLMTNGQVSMKSLQSLTGADPGIFGREGGWGGGGTNSTR